MESKKKKVGRKKERLGEVSRAEGESSEVDVVATSKHETVVRCWLNVGPSSATLAQHCANIGLMCRVCWDVD